MAGRVETLPTRCASIDNAIGGGFAVGYLSEVCGESGVGKTQLCLQLVANTITSVECGGLGGSAIYISWGTPFPWRRLEQMLPRQQVQARPSTNAGPSAQSVNPSVNPLDRLTCWRGTTAYDLRELVNNLEPTLSTGFASGKDYKLVIIDTMYGFVTHQFPNTADGNYMRTQLVKSVGFGLKRLAKKHNVVVVACNNAVDLYGAAYFNAFRSSGRLMKPGIGLNWDRNLYIRYVMAKESIPGQEGWVRTFQILDKGAYYGRCRFKITEEGVCSA